MTSWITPAAWGAAGGAVATVVRGFSASWVTTTSSARATAEEEAEAAVLSALTPICVARLKVIPPQSQQARWTAMPGVDALSDALAEACAVRVRG